MLLHSVVTSLVNTERSYFTYLTVECSYFTCYCTVYVTLPFILHSVVNSPMLLHSVCYFTYVTAVYVKLLHSVAILHMLLYSVVTLPMLLQCSYFNYVTAQCTLCSYIRATVHSERAFNFTLSQYLQIFVFLHKYFSLIAAEYKTNANNGNYKNTVKPALFIVYPDIQLVTTYK
jgi:hypothetical protein